MQKIDWFHFGGKLYSALYDPIFQRYWTPNNAARIHALRCKSVDLNSKSNRMFLRWHSCILISFLYFRCNIIILIDSLIGAIRRWTKWGGGGGSSEPNSQVELQICSRKIPRGLLNLAISSGRISTCRVVWGDRKPNIRGLTMLYNIFFIAQVNRELHFILKFDHHDLRYFHWFQATEA